MGGQSIAPGGYETVARHFAAGRLADVVAVCAAILQCTPPNAGALRLLGLAQCGLGAHDQGAYFLTAALAAMPPEAADSASVLEELAAALSAQGDHAGALDCYRRALQRDPHDVPTLSQYGGALAQLNRHAEAIAQYRKALAIAPGSADLRTHEGIVLLTMGEWAAGWRSFEARLTLPKVDPANRFPRDVPRWRGETDIAGRTMLLQAEQGLGDTLNFVRYVPLVAARGARVILRVQRDLGKLLAGIQGADVVLTNDDDVAGVDLWCPLMGLPLAFGTDVTNIMSEVPYIRPRAEYVLLWQALLGLRRRPRIGIVWSARQYIPLRNMPLGALGPLLARGDLEFHALQQEIPEQDRVWLKEHPAVVDHSAELKDFADTAALVSLLDLVVTIDTAVAHLAGAMARPVWLMLPYSADWRWLTDRTDTPWYPTARLYRQQRPRDWQGVVAAVARDLAAQFRR